MHELDKIRIYVKKVLKREPNDHAQTIVFIFTNRIALGSLKKFTFVTGGRRVQGGPFLLRYVELFSSEFDAAQWFSWASR